MVDAALRCRAGDSFRCGLHGVFPSSEERQNHFHNLRRRRIGNPARGVCGAFRRQYNIVRTFGGYCRRFLLLCANHMLCGTFAGYKHAFYA